MNSNGSLTFLFVLSCLFGISFAQNRIVGGQITQIENSPYVVSLSRNNVYYCAGALLSYSHVITAARCIVGIQPGQILVKAGRVNLQQTGRQNRRVLQAFYPSAYNPTTRFMDIGGLKLRVPFNPTARVGIAPRCSTVMSPGTQMQIYGWGSLNEARTTNVPNLHSVTVPIVNRQTCANQYQAGSINIARTSVCAGNGSGDACNLDTGGPGIVNGQLCGVISFGAGCNRPEYPGVYTNLRNARVQRFVTNILAK